MSILFPKPLNDESTAWNRELSIFDPWILRTCANDALFLRTKLQVVGYSVLSRMALGFLPFLKSSYLGERVCVVIVDMISQNRFLKRSLLLCISRAWFWRHLRDSQLVIKFDGKQETQSMVVTYLFNSTHITKYSSAISQYGNLNKSKVPDNRQT